MLKPCEIIYVEKVRGWKWRSVTKPGATKAPFSEETFPLFYDCVSAARASGYNPNFRCL